MCILRGTNWISRFQVNLSLSELNAAVKMKSLHTTWKRYIVSLILIVGTKYGPFRTGEWLASRSDSLPPGERGPGTNWYEARWVSVGFDAQSCETCCHCLEIEPPISCNLHRLGYPRSTVICASHVNWPWWSHLNDSFVFVREPSSYSSQVMGEVRLRNARGLWQKKPALALWCSVS